MESFEVRMWALLNKEKLRKIEAMTSIKGWEVIPINQTIEQINPCIARE